MYIKCEQCNILYRLDENLLKPAGSKVRCSQCGYLFMAYRPAAADSGALDTPATAEAMTQTVAPVSEPAPAEAFEQELEGIDLAELDSILEQDRTQDRFDAPGAGSRGDRAADRETEEPAELDDNDLNLDFESGLELDSEQVIAPQAGRQDPEDEKLDLNMDFDLGADEPPVAQESGAESGLIDDDLDMDFELAQGPDQQGGSEQQAGPVDSGEAGLAEDIDLVLDGFEDVLDQPEESQGDSPAAEANADQELSLAMDADLGEESVSPGQEPAPGKEAPAATGERTGPEPAGDDLDLDDLASVLDEELSPEAKAPEGEELELFLDEDLELTLGEEPQSEAPAGTETRATAPAGADAEEFDLTDLEGLLDDEEAPAQGVEAAPETSTSPLEDDHAMMADEATALEFEMDTDEARAAAGSGQADDGLDLGGFDDILDEDQPAVDEEPEDLELSLDEELDFESGDKAKTADAPSAAEDEFDLGSFDAILDAEDEEVQGPGKDELDLVLDEEPEPFLDEEPKLEMESKQASGGDAGELEDLEFELDAEYEDKPVAHAAAADQPDEPVQEEEIDLSDIEKMLEDDTLVPEKGAQTQDLFDLAGGAEKWTDESEDDSILGSGGEIDLTEIEAAIDSAADEIDAGIDDDRELELDFAPDEQSKDQPGEELELKLEMDTESSTTSGGLHEEDKDEIDLSDLDFSPAQEKTASEPEIIDTGDIELEFQIAEDNEPARLTGEKTQAAGKTTSGFSMDGEPETAGAAESDDEAMIAEALAGQPIAAKAMEKMAAAPKKKGAGKFLIVVLILALLGAGGYFGYGYVVENHIQIPYLSDLINPQPKDPNNIEKLTTLEINSKFIENAHAGRIFVVTGKVRNGYTVPCKMIRLQGKLFTKGKVLSKTENIVAGTLLSDQELTSQELAQIKQRLEAPAAQDATVVANPGQTLPFMVVFSDLPVDLDEFAVELTSSAKAP
jgi:pilus assembly protein FimV